jgi:hypothetical protein
MSGAGLAGTVADLVLWRPENFGSKPEMVIKGGVIAFAQMGDANASIPSVQPFVGRPIWGRRLRVGGLDRERDGRWVWAHGALTPRVTVDPEMYEARADGVIADVGAAEVLPLGRVFNWTLPLNSMNHFDWELFDGPLVRYSMHTTVAATQHLSYLFFQRNLSSLF